MDLHARRAVAGRASRCGSSSPPGPAGARSLRPRGRRRPTTASIASSGRAPRPSSARPGHERCTIGRCHASASPPRPRRRRGGRPVGPAGADRRRARRAGAPREHLPPGEPAIAGRRHRRERRLRRRLAERLLLRVGTQDGSQSGIFGRRFDASGAPLGGEIPINATTLGPQSSPSVATSPGGSFVTAFAGGGYGFDQDGSASGVFLRRVAAATRRSEPTCR